MSNEEEEEDEFQDGRGYIRDNQMTDSDECGVEIS